MLVVFSVISISCSRAQQTDGDALVLIKTEFGNIKLKLYDDTPEHKKNFIKLIDEEFYDGLLFHRVIKDFMIQGGDPKSKNAQPGARLGSGSPGYTLAAEINPKHFHKKGALAAARQGGPSNPEKRSGGSQFYIIQGSVYTAGKLDSLEMMMNSRLKNDLMKKVFTDATDELNVYRTNNDQAGFNVRIAELREVADSLYNASEKVSYSPEQREAYTTVGGYPSLDNDYTVFGEIIEGFDVLDEIASSETDKADRPITDIIMEIKLIK